MDAARSNVRFYRTRIERGRLAGLKQLIALEIVALSPLVARFPGNAEELDLMIEELRGLAQGIAES